MVIISHRHIIEFVGSGIWDESAQNSIFLVEEFVEGGTLKQLIMRQMETKEHLYRIQVGLAGVTVRQGEGGQDDLVRQSCTYPYLNFSQQMLHIKHSRNKSMKPSQQPASPDLVGCSTVAGRDCQGPGIPS